MNYFSANANSVSLRNPVPIQYINVREIWAYKSVLIEWRKDYTRWGTKLFFDIRDNLMEL